MNDDKKITLTVIAEMLSKRKGMTYDVHEIEILIFGWIKHPRYKSPTRATISARGITDGEQWLKADEVVSFFRYAGYPVRL